jgi:hypothetical protein
VSGLRHTFKRVKHLIADRTGVGLLDAADFAASRPPSLALGRIRRVGPVPVCWDARPFGLDLGAALGELIGADPDDD